MTAANTVKFERFPDGSGKYALLKNRELLALQGEQLAAAMEAIATLRGLGVVDFGEEGTDREFFVMRLKDAWAAEPLAAYAGNARRDGQEAYGEAVLGLALRAGRHSPHRKTPD
jgi:hypothetical protein